MSRAILFVTAKTQAFLEFGVIFSINTNLIGTKANLEDFAQEKHSHMLKALQIHELTSLHEVQYIEKKEIRNKAKGKMIIW